ncbi:MAG TPA: ABC transporter permease [Chloroflexota bacterium]|nr:ABC transporter permease [Chloroflexota bacterium]
MAAYIARRFASLLLTMFVVTIVIFALMHSVPGGPFSYVNSQQPLPPFAYENILRKYGLDKPVWQQYLLWLWAVLHGDFGIPFESPTETVIGLIARAWPITIRIGLITLVVAYVLGLTLGIVAAFKQNTWIDGATTFLATCGIVLPSFVIGFVLIDVFSVGLHWFPTGGCCEPKQYVMPVFAYMLGPMAGVARYTRTSMLEVIRSEYVTMARARGLPEWRVLRRYVLRTALIPLITILGPDIPNVLTGSIFIEATFAIPGLGSYFTTASETRDYPMIMALVLMVSFLWGTLYLLSDLAYTIVDPRVRLEGLSR